MYQLQWSTKITTHTFKNFATAERKYLVFGIIIREPFFTLTLSTLFHSLIGNTIEDSGATALAEALRVNHSLETLK